MRISDWSSDVCSSDLGVRRYVSAGVIDPHQEVAVVLPMCVEHVDVIGQRFLGVDHQCRLAGVGVEHLQLRGEGRVLALATARSEEHTSELQSLMRISYAVFCLKKKKSKNTEKT